MCTFYQDVYHLFYATSKSEKEEDTRILKFCELNELEKGDIIDQAWILYETLPFTILQLIVILE